MIEIRLATEADAEAIASIYNQAVKTGFQTGDTNPVSTESRKLWLQAHPSSRYPVYVLDIDGSVAGWLSVSPYRPGREALRFTAEVSYYVERAQRGKGVASRLLAYAIEQAPKLGLKTYFAIALDRNAVSAALLEKYGFERWGFLPGVADFDGEECGQLYYGRRVENGFTADAPAT